MMTRAVKVKDYKALFRNGEWPVDAWAPFPKSFIVVHQMVDFEGRTYGDFILAHRVSGMAIRTWKYHYETKRAALNAARKIAKFPNWSKVGRPKTTADKIPGWTKKIAATLGNKIEKALREHLASNTLFPLSPCPTPIVASSASSRDAMGCKAAPSGRRG